MKRLFSCLLLTMLVPIAGVAVDATPAHACSCVSLSDVDAESFAVADAVFVGRLIDYKAPRQAVSTNPAVWTFKVRDVYKGQVPRKQEVVSAVSGTSCGLEIPKHGTFLVFATANSSSSVDVRPKGGQLQANLCGGTRALGNEVLDPGLGKPYPPRRVPSKNR